MLSFFRFMILSKWKATEHVTVKLVFETFQGHMPSVRDVHKWLMESKGINVAQIEVKKIAGMT